MMNALALGLVLTSLLTSVFFTPNTETQKQPEDDIIVKEGHRVVVVEFEREDKHTKVLISPPDSERIADDAQSKTKDEEEITHDQHGFKPKELVCDAYGKCVHKISSAFKKTKEAASEKTHLAVEKAHQVEEEIKKGITGMVEKVKDTAFQTAHQAFDKMQDSKESLEKAKDKAAEKAGEIKEEVKVKASEKMEDAKKAEKELSVILHRGRDVWVDTFRYAFSPEKLAALSGVLHMLGFAVAYGMCVWVTFASSSVLAGALPRNQFAMVQSRIYPVYFKAMAYSMGMAMLGHLMGHWPKSGVGMFQGFNLMASLVMILVNLLYLEPRAAKVMFERMKKEKEEGKGKVASGPGAEMAGRGGLSTAEIGGRIEKQDEDKARSEMVRLSEKLQKLNSYSSFLNVLTLMSITWHLVHLGQRVHLAACV